MLNTAVTAIDLTRYIVGYPAKGSIMMVAITYDQKNTYSL
jgi:hypothetical protein